MTAPDVPAPVANPEIRERAEQQALKLLIEATYQLENVLSELAEGAKPADRVAWCTQVRQLAALILPKSTVVQHKYEPGSVSPEATPNAN